MSLCKGVGQSKPKIVKGLEHRSWQIMRKSL